jgi:protein-tyrosine kinase
MSRIADALKRASEIVANRDESHLPGQKDSWRGSDNAPLEQYAREDDGPSRALRKRDDHIPVESSPRDASDRRDGIETVVRSRDTSERPPAVQRSVAVADPRPQLQAVRVAVESAFAGNLVGTEGSAESAEQYKRLATTLHDIQARSEWNGAGAVGRGLKTLLVSSAVAGEGKTLTAVNLALTLSESARQRVLLIDLNLQHPSVHDALGLPNTPGVADILRSDSIRKVPLLMISPSLSVLPAGRFAGSLMEALGSDAMRALLDETADRFDWVILDGPAVQQMSHPAVAARLSRAVLFVIASGSTAHPVVDRAITEIGRGCVIGAVLNRVKVP